MNSKKRMMFILEEDYYFITIKILSILKALECEKKPFEDYTRLAILFELMKDEKDFIFYKKIINQDNRDLFDNERLIKIFCDSKMGESVIKRVLFFLEKQHMVELKKSLKNESIDVLLIENKEFEDLVREGVLNDDLERVLYMKKTINRLRSLKIQTLQTKIFGYDEVKKWVN